MRLSVKKTFMTLLFACLSFDVFAAGYSDIYRESTFHLGMSQVQYDLAGKDQLQLKGNSVAVSLGGGFLHRSYYDFYSLDILLGPYQPLSNEEARLDYSGTGFSTNWGWTWESNGLRDKNGSFGIALGLHYLDIVGRAVGTRTSETGTISGLVTQVYDFAIIPGFFYANLKPARKKGNDPELLVTRLEGVLISLGIAYPIQADFTQEYLRRDNTGMSEKVKSKGDLDGRTYILQILTPLGI